MNRIVEVNRVIDMKRFFLILVFTSFVIWLQAQCDTLKDVTLKVEYIERIHTNMDYYPLDTEPYTDPVPNPNEARRIYFIHGLGGTPASWSKAAEACENSTRQDFPARRCETIRTDYVNSTISLYSAATDVRNGIANQADIDRIRGVLAPERAILIAHSQGGLVARELMHLDLVTDLGNSTLARGMNYGGVVTVSAPLQGARILNNRDKILAMVNDGCKKVLMGPEDDVARKINSEIPVLNVKAKLATIFLDIADKACDVVTYASKTIFFNKYFKGITDDYIVGAPHINILNSDADKAKYQNFPKIAFYTVEPQENIFWRTLTWIVNEPNDVAAFSANDDWKLLDNTINPMINDYKVNFNDRYGGYLRHLYLYRTACHLCFITRISQNRMMMDDLNSAIAWDSGLEWFNNANKSWKTIIGGNESYHKVMNEWGIIGKENDGIVLAESAADLPSATFKSVRVFPKENDLNAVNRGSSHMQVRNDEGLREHLFNLFEGKYDPFFRVYEKK